MRGALRLSGPFGSTRKGCTLAAIASLGAAFVPLTLDAQEDFRAADVDRPIRVEDAIPIKFREWEVEFGARGVVGEGDRGLLALAELKTGLFRNTQVGIELEGGVEREAGGGPTLGGFEAATVHVLYGLSRETARLPALALRVEASTPGAGALRHEDARLGMKGIATRSFGRTRLHTNLGYTIGSAVDGGDFWRAGLGVDYPLGLFSRALLADVYAEIPASSGRTRAWAELGLRIQTTNWAVVDLGLGTRIDEWERGNANLEITVGLSRVFGVPGFVRVDDYPNPSIP